MVGGGESGWIAPDPNDPNVLYASGVYGSVVRWDRRTSLSQDITPWPMQNFGSEINQRKYRDPWTPVLVLSPLEKNTLYLGTQYVMKTTDGGLHWQEISPDLDRRGRQARPPASLRGPQRRRTPCSAASAWCTALRPRRCRAKQIWAGTDTGLMHITRTREQAGRTSRLRAESVEQDRHDRGFALRRGHVPTLRSIAIVSTIRSRTSIARAITAKPGSPSSTASASTSFVNAIREDPQVKGLLFAGTELGIYVSFDDGDHWQPLQLNLPVTSFATLTIHGDDLVVATHGRSFWILDDITPLRQMTAQTGDGAAGSTSRRRPVRVDNDVFLGSPLPPEEPAGQEPARRRHRRLLLTISGEEGQARDLRRQRQAGSPLQQRRRKGTASSADGHRRTLDAEANLVGEYRWCSIASVWDLRWGSSGASCRH